MIHQPALPVLLTNNVHGHYARKELYRAIHLDGRKPAHRSDSRGGQSLRNARDLGRLCEDFEGQIGNLAIGEHLRPTDTELLFPTIYGVRTNRGKIGPMDGVNSV